MEDVKQRKNSYRWKLDSDINYLINDTLGEFKYDEQLLNLSSYIVKARRIVKISNALIFKQLYPLNWSKLSVYDLGPIVEKGEIFSPEFFDLTLDAQADIVEREDLINKLEIVNHIGHSATKRSLNQLKDNLTGVAPDEDIKYIKEYLRLVIHRSCQGSILVFTEGINVVLIHRDGYASVRSNNYDVVGMAPKKEFNKFSNGGVFDNGGAFRKNFPVRFFSNILTPAAGMTGKLEQCIAGQFMFVTTVPKFQCLLKIMAPTIIASIIYPGLKEYIKVHDKSTPLQFLNEKLLLRAGSSIRDIADNKPAMLTDVLKNLVHKEYTSLSTEYGRNTASCIKTNFLSKKARTDKDILSAVLAASLCTHTTITQ